MRYRPSEAETANAREWRTDQQVTQHALRQSVPISKHVLHKDECSSQQRSGSHAATSRRYSFFYYIVILMNTDVVTDGCNSRSDAKYLSTVADRGGYVSHGYDETQAQPRQQLSARTLNHSPEAPVPFFATDSGGAQQCDGRYSCEHKISMGNNVRSEHSSWWWAAGSLSTVKEQRRTQSS